MYGGKLLGLYFVNSDGSFFWIKYFPWQSNIEMSTYPALLTLQSSGEVSRMKSCHMIDTTLILFINQCKRSV